MRFNEEVLREGLNLPPGSHRGIVTDGAGNSRCYSCGFTWKAEPVYPKWPISFRWAHLSSRFFARWGVQVGSEAPMRPTYATIIAIGRLRICFGLIERPADKACARHAPPGSN